MIRPLVILGSVLACAAALAQPLGEDEAARRALAAHDYEQVIKLYAAAESSSKPLADMARYRLAIAHLKTQNPVAAWRQLQQALELNPKGSFASTPARLADLQASILAACDSAGRPGCRELAPPPAQVAAAVVSDKAPASQAPESSSVAATAATAAVTAAPAAPGASPASQGSSSTAAVLKPQADAPALARAAPERAPAMGAAAAPTHAMGSEVRRPDLWQLCTLAVAALTLLVVAWCARRIYLRDKRIPMGLDSVEALRDNVAAMLTSLHSTQRGRDSALYAPLGQLLPLLEREAGRTLYRATGSTRALTALDKRALELAEHMSARPPNVLTASPQEIEAQFRRTSIA